MFKCPLVVADFVNFFTFFLWEKSTHTKMLETNALIMQIWTSLSYLQVFRRVRMPVFMRCHPVLMTSATRASLLSFSLLWNMSRALTVEEATLNCSPLTLTRKKCMETLPTTLCSVRCHCVLWWNKRSLNNLNDRILGCLYLSTCFCACLGPDICGPGTKKVHVIFNYKGKNHLINKDIRCKVMY